MQIDITLGYSEMSKGEKKIKILKDRTKNILTVLILCLSLDFLVVALPSASAFAPQMTIPTYLIEGY
jgi:hypothetical protein